MSHPQVMEIEYSCTSINCDYIYKRGHNLLHVGVFYLQHIFDHILNKKKGVPFVNDGFG